MEKDFEEITKKTYDIVSSNWDSKRQYLWKPISDFLMSFENPENLRLLDLGCGTGRCLEFAKNVGFDCENLVGSDYSQGQLEIVSRKGFKVVCQDMLDLSFDDESFDVVLCIAAHHHLLDREKQILALKEMMRILKKKGKLLLCNWFPEEDFIKKQEEKGKFVFLDDRKKCVKVTYSFNDKKYDRFYYLFDEGELKKQFLEVGFNILSSKYDRGNLYFILEK